MGGDASAAALSRQLVERVEGVAAAGIPEQMCYKITTSEGRNVRVGVRYATVAAEQLLCYHSRNGHAVECAIDPVKQAMAEFIGASAAAKRVLALLQKASITVPLVRVAGLSFVITAQQPARSARQHRNTLWKLKSVTMGREGIASIFSDLTLSGTKDTVW